MTACVFSGQPLYYVQPRDDCAGVSGKISGGVLDGAIGREKRPTVLRANGQSARCTRIST